MEKQQTKLIGIKRQIDTIYYLFELKKMYHKIRDCEFQLSYDGSNCMWNFHYLGYVTYRFEIYNEHLDYLLDSVKREFHTIIIKIKNKDFES